jgi:hypothetical protein
MVFLKIITHYQSKRNIVSYYEYSRQQRDKEKYKIK